MLPNYSIPNPCSENWDQMTPTEQGRFCGKCSKVVMDFSEMSHEDIMTYLNKQKVEVCGRVRKEQLLLQPTLSHKLKKFLYAFVLVFLPFLAVAQSDSTYEGATPKETVTKTTGGIQGTLRNEQHQIIPHAEVTLIQNGKTLLVASADSLGFYKIAPLEIGVYEIEFSAKGYKTVIMLNANLTKNKMWRLSTSLNKIDPKSAEIYEIRQAPSFIEVGCYMSGGMSAVSHVQYDRVLDTPNWFINVHRLLSIDILND